MYLFREIRFIHLIKINKNKSLLFINTYYVFDIRSIRKNLTNTLISIVKKIRKKNILLLN